MSEFAVVTGLSGAGRSHAANVLQDLGWFKIDNLPPALIPSIVELASAPGSATQRVALVVGTGHHDHEILPALDRLRASGERVRVLFLEAPVEVLVARYEATRRPHPLDDGSGRLAEFIAREARLLVPVRETADVVIDTGALSVHDLRRRITDVFGAEDDDRMTISVRSFGFKHGLPRDVDMVLDCRFLPNPHWIEELRPLTGLDEPVRDHVLATPQAREFLDGVERLLVPLLPSFEHEGKSYLAVALGCTGGRHRSVAVAEELARRLRTHGYSPAVTHRDLER